jgi:hypothetical protein
MPFARGNGLYRDGRDHAKPRKLGLFRSGEQAWLEPEGRDPLEKLRAIRGVAHRRRRDRVELLEPHFLAEQAEAGKRDQRLLDRFLLQRAIVRDALAKRGHDLFVEQRRGHARIAAERHEPHRV